jgi:hypothetical protein
VAERDTPSRSDEDAGRVASGGGHGEVTAAAPRGALGRRFHAAVSAAGLPGEPVAAAPVTEGDLAGLPSVARRYLRFMGVIGRPRDWSFRARFVGRFWLRRELGWMPAQAWQYNSGLAVGRVFVMQVRVAGILPMIGRDTYLGGHGRMVGKLLDRFTVVDGQGDEFDIGELTTYLNDAVLLAPSMLLGPTTTWTGIDANSFDVTFRDAGRSVTGRVFVDERGAPYDFSTTDRFAALPTGLVRAEWRTPVASWGVVNGRPLPGPLRAVWQFPAGPLPYIKGRIVPGSVAYNIRPGSPRGWT